MKLKNAPGKKNDRRHEALAGLIIHQARDRYEYDQRRIANEIATLRARIVDDRTARNTRTKKNRAA